MLKPGAERSIKAYFATTPGLPAYNTVTMENITPEGLSRHFFFLQGLWMIIASISKIFNVI